jgi:hypothetical protein
MNFVHHIATTVFYEAPDGRIVYQPLGRWGPCYRLTPAQRLTRAKIVVGFIAVSLVATGFYMLYFTFYYRSLPGFVDVALRVAPLVIAGNLVLSWFLSRGLPTTEHPPPIPPSYRRELIHRQRQWLDSQYTFSGWYSLIGGSILGAVMVWAGIHNGEWGMAMGGGLFGLGSVLFSVWRLRRRP